LADEDRLYFNQMYYNIIKYEFNYLNFIAYSNSYVFFWLNSVYSGFNSYFLGTGQLRLNKFNYVSLLESKIEVSFFSNLIQEDGDPVEWRFFPYEHLTHAFPESDFYLTDAIYQYADTDLAFDFRVKPTLQILMPLHPYSFGNIYESQYDYEYDDSFLRIKNFFKNYKNSDEILTTYVRRFKLLYKNYYNANLNLDNGVFFSKNMDSYLEMSSKNLDLDFEFFLSEDLGFPETVSFRMEYDKFNMDKVYKLFNTDSDENASLYLDRYKFRLLNDNNFSLIKNNNLNSDERLINMSEKFIKDSYVNDFSSYSRFSKSLISGNFSNNNFFSFFVNNAFFQWLIRSKFFWSMISSSSNEDGAFDFEASASTISSYVTDKYLMKKYENIFSFLNFTESYFFDRNTYNYSQSFFLYNDWAYYSLDQVYAPPYVSFFGYKSMNPFIRNNVDISLFNDLGLRSKFLISWAFNYQKSDVYEISSRINFFNALKYNSYFLGYSGYPVSLTVSTNFSEFDLYSNSNLDELRPLEVQNLEDVDNYMPKEEIYTMVKSVVFMLIPLVCSSFYCFVLYTNIIF